MKTRFSTLDIIAILPELKAKLCTGWRVNQVYDCDQKTYLFKLNKSIVQMKKDDDPLSVDEETANKMSFIIESGQRLHTTDFDWPKSHAPSHFATKLRKHIRNKRIEDITQVGVDRLVDIQFGTNLAANHLIIELYDKGNLVLTDNNYSIICILRWRKTIEMQSKSQLNEQLDSENFRVGQTYPLQHFRKYEDLEPLTEVKISEMLNNSRILLGSNQNYKKRNRAKQEQSDGTVEINLKDLFNPHVVYGSSLLEDRLLTHVFKDIEKPRKCSIRISISDASGRLDQQKVREYAQLIKAALDDAEITLKEVRERKQSPGYIVQKKLDSDLVDRMNKRNNLSDMSSKKPKDDKDQESKPNTTNIDFFPILTCAQRKIEQETVGLTYETFDSFDRAVDVYYSNLESQKFDSKTMVAEREAMKKLDNLKIAQEKRLDELARVQREDEERARLIELNCDKVENALLIIRSMLAGQISWADIWNTIKEAQSMEDPIASLITQVKFDRNEFTMKLCDPYEEEVQNGLIVADEQNTNKRGNKKKSQHQHQQNSRYKNVDIDISLSAHANARRFFTKRRTAVNKEKKTIEVSKKAFKNVERQTKEKLKEVVVTTNISKARKRYWFENFFWFISSDGYLVVAGRDSEQNEMLVKRYMKNNDIYVHADLHGASSVIIKNETSDPIPPKTLVEAGSMAVCYSSAWDSKIATTSWWVYPKQVSKTAPTGEYLTQGAFVIRGKKNFLPLSNLVLGFGFLFRLEEDSIERRKKVRLAREQSQLENGTIAGSSEDPKELEQDLSDTDENDDNDDKLPISEATSSDEDEQMERSKSSMELKAAHDERVGADEVEKGEGKYPGALAKNLNDGGNKIVDGADYDHDVDAVDDDDDRVIEHRLIDTLTENPLPDDVLLYSIPMCGPYSALQNFKYKVKVIPGSNKRGKAAKSCLTMFLHDKRASQREKDLLKALKDQDYARNIPNKVKVSAANMKTLTKKRPKKSEVRLPAH